MTDFFYNRLIPPNEKGNKVIFSCEIIVKLILEKLVEGGQVFKKKLTQPSLFFLSE
jgi:hypothetical protein